MYFQLNHLLKFTLTFQTNMDNIFMFKDWRLSYNIRRIITYFFFKVVCVV